VERQLSTLELYRLNRGEWGSIVGMGLESVTRSIEVALERLGSRIVYRYVEEHGDPEWGASVEDLGLDPSLVKALKGYGIERLFKFQVEALNSIRSGRDTLIVAGTGTGKTEAFLVPVIDSILRSKRGLGPHAILVYPTKALARDQVSRMKLLAQPGLGVRVSILDGDTPPDERRRIYNNPPDILVTNPDMIHFGLALSRDFRSLVSRARFIVLDEVHVYNGVFGSHVRWVLSRLSRYTGDDVVMVGSGATIGNPEVFGEKLFNRSVNVVLGPRRRRGVAVHYMVECGRASRWTVASTIVALLAKGGLKVLAFTDSQQMAELLARITAKSYGVRVGVHRAGLKAEYRREVEEAFKEGVLRALVATSTLELGIDIGDLDAVVLTNLPKSYSSYIQRAGRAGRRGRVGLIYTILGDDAIEAYYTLRPREYFEQDMPPSYLEPYNVEVAKTHIAAMLMERGVLRVESIEEGLLRAIEELRDQGIITISNGLVRGVPERVRGFLESRGGIRSTGYQVRIFEESEEIGFRELPEALLDLHPGAVYYHAGVPYISLKLDLESGMAVVRRVREVSYYTRPLYTVDVEEFKPLDSTTFNNLKLLYGDVRVTLKVEGYIVRDETSGALIAEVPLEKPLKWSYWTKGFMGRYPDAGFHDVVSAISSYHALEHVIISASKPVAGVADTDLGGVSYPSGHIVIYDSSPGGNGASRLVLERFEKVVEVAEVIVSSCSCADGCPRCVYSPYCGNNNRFLSRRGALRLIDIMRRRGVEPLEPGRPQGQPVA
jgi:DEAD/DEAH box helicase domain-containing protein